MADGPVYQLLRTSTAGKPPPRPLAEGEPYVDIGASPVAAMWIGAPGRPTGMVQVGGGVATPVSLLNGGTGVSASTPAVALTALGGAPLASPALTGTPTLVTPPALTDSSNILATTAWVTSKIASATSGVSQITATAPITASASTGAVALSLSASGATAGSYTNADLTIDQFGRVTTAANGTPGGGGTITSITAGAGLTGGTITASGTLALDNSGVTAQSYTNTNLTVDQYGRITAASNGSAGAPGTVTSITAGTGLTGGTISVSGTIALGTSGVTAASYTNTNLTVDQYGRITSAANGDPGGAGSSSALATDTGKLYVNVNTVETFPSSGAVAQITGADIGADSSTTLVIDAIGAPTLRLRKLMGSVAQTTAGTAPLPANNVQLGLIEIQGYNNVGISKMGGAAQIRFVSSGAWTSTNQGTSVQFFTVKNNSTSLTTAMYISGTGGLVIGGSAPDQGSGSISAETIWAAGEDLRVLIQDLDDRLTAIGA